MEIAAVATGRHICRALSLDFAGVCQFQHRLLQLDNLRIAFGECCFDLSDAGNVGRLDPLSGSTVQRRRCLALRYWRVAVRLARLTHQ